MSDRPRPTSRATADELLMLEALARCGHELPVPAPSRAFVRRLAARGCVPDAVLRVSWEQSETLISLVIRCRALMPSSVVAVARALAKAGPWRDAARWRDAELELRAART